MPCRSTTLRRCPALTPIEALNFLYELKKTLKGSLNG